MSNPEIVNQLDAQAYAINEYLRTRSLKEIRHGGEFMRGAHQGAAYEHVIILPMKDEQFHSVINLVGLDESLLIIACLNQSVSENGAKDLAGNTAVWDFCLGLGHLAGTSGNMTYVANVGASGKTGILLIDCFTVGRRLGIEQGIGIARKVCYDAAVMMIHGGIVANRWIRSTDADTLLTKAHFAPEVLPKDSTAAGACFPFDYIQDRASHAVFAATLMHHEAGRYLLNGLASAGYPFYYHVLGSAMAISHCHYCLAGGAPDVRVTEDVSLMFGVYQYGDILQPATPPIRIKARSSNRCAGGTGVTADKLVNDDCITPDKVKTYSPLGFTVLGHLLKGEILEGSYLTNEQWQRCKVFIGDTSDLRRVGLPRIFKMLNYLHEQCGFELVTLEAGMAFLYGSPVEQSEAAEAGA
jgi:hypothetical protein